MIQALISLLFAFIPVAIYMWIVLAMDRYDREPMGLVLINFGWGVLCAVLLIVFSVFSDTFADKVYAAPVVEEFLKALILLWTARRKAFDNITDGLVYGMAIGLGFGLAENFTWFLGASTVGSWAVRILERTLFTLIMHAMATGITGAVFGYTKFRSAAMRWPLRFVGLALAISAHGYWNYAILTLSVDAPRIDILYIILGLAVIFLVLQISLLTENRILRTELAAEAADGLIPITHLQYLPYSTKRRVLGWLPPSIDKKRYIELTTRLAFRRYQARHSDKSDRPMYEQEVRELRESIDHMLTEDRLSPASQLY